MIDIKCDEGRLRQEICGTMPELLADTMLIIHGIFLDIYDISPIDSLLFRTCIEENISKAFKLDDSDFKILENRKKGEERNE